MQDYDSMGRINTQAPVQRVPTTVNDNVCISEHHPESMLNAFSTRTWQAGDGIQMNCLDLAISQCIYIIITSSSIPFIVCICQLKIQRKNDYYSQAEY